MTLLSWKPFRDTDGILGRFVAPTAMDTQMARPAGDDLEWVPAVEISEAKNEYLVQTELPGIKREDIQVQAQDGVLSISGERQEEPKKDSGDKALRTERYYGQFRRSFSLPKEIDANALSAELKDGVLTVRLPRVKKPETRMVEVKVN